MLVVLAHTNASWHLHLHVHVHSKISCLALRSFAINRVRRATCDSLQFVYSCIFNLKLTFLDFITQQEDIVSTPHCATSFIQATDLQGASWGSLCLLHVIGGKQEAEKLYNNSCVHLQIHCTCMYDTCSLLSSPMMTWCIHKVYPCTCTCMWQNTKILSTVLSWHVYMYTHDRSMWWVKLPKHMLLVSFASYRIYYSRWREYYLL